MNMAGIRTIRYFLIQLVGLYFLFNHTAYSQSFQEKPIKDLSSMENNYGCAVADYDQDGDLDVFIVAYAPFHPDIPKSWSRLLKNYGNGRFEDVTIQAGFRVQYKSSMVVENKYGASWGDYDNDGFPDLFLTHTGKVQLYRNKGDGTFEDVTRNSGIKFCPKCVNMGAIWWDYNRDGNLDLYVNNHSGKNRLLRNVGEGKFEDLSETSVLADHRATWSSLPFDANDDGWPDLLVLNDFGQSRFYINHSGTHFTEETQSFGLHNPGDAMGAALGDYNNDGYFDIYITNISEFYPNRLFSRKADGVYQDVAIDLDVGVGHWAWGTNFFDADHDGDQDLYIVNGTDGFINENKFYKNMMMEGEAGFTDWSSFSGANSKENGMGSEVFDFDDDGDLDILITNTNESPMLYENTSAVNSTNWLQVEFTGDRLNSSIMGAKLIAAGEGHFFHRYAHGTAIMSQSMKPVHFGLGSVRLLDSLMVVWPDQTEMVLYDVDVNRKIHIGDEPVGRGLVTGVEPGPGVGINLYPNPFFSQVTLESHGLHPGQVSWSIFSTDGRKVYQVKKYSDRKGDAKLLWDGRDGAGTIVSPGIYFYQYLQGNSTITGKILFKSG